jgi:hypothetical protein
MTMTVSTQAQDLWYEAYERGLEAIKQSDWALAEQKLTEAIQKRPEQGRRVRFYGVLFQSYLPQYYLAIVYYHQGRWAEAAELFRSVEQAGLVTTADVEYDELNGYLRNTEAALNGLIDQERANAQAASLADALQTARTALSRAEAQEAHARPAAYDSAIAAADAALALDPGNDEILAIRHKAVQGLNDSVVLSNEFDSLIQRARVATADGEYEDARRLASDAAALDVDTLRVRGVVDEINKAEGSRYLALARSALREGNTELARENASRASDLGLDRTFVNNLIEEARQFEETLKLLRALVDEGRWLDAEPIAGQAVGVSPESAEVKALAQQVMEELARIDDLEALTRAGIRAFYLGSYEQSRQLLEVVVQQSPTSSRASLYIACSLAALGLLNPPMDPKTLQTARGLYQIANQGQTDFSADRQFISPRIIDLLEQRSVQR